MLVQIIAMSALALVSEFAELLPVGVAGFVYGLTTLRPDKAPAWVSRIVSLACIAVCLVTYLLRREFWWLVTDDYQHIEVMMRHLSQSSPFSNWGAFNYGINYHWLSYAWGGLLNEVSFSEQHFQTMTQVMPFVYSLSLVASLAHISHLVAQSSWRRLNVIPVWMAIAFVPLDWSGTSTAGVYAVLAAFVAVVIPLVSSSGEFRFGTGVLLCLFFVVLALTKIPATFSILVFLGFVCLGMIDSRLTNQSAKAGFALLGGLTTLLLCFVSIWALSQLTDDAFRFSRSNPALGQIGQTHPLLTAILLIGTRLWLWSLALNIFLHNFGTQGLIRSRFVSGLGVLFLVVGLALEVFISAPANNYEYFGNPMYFMTAISLLVSLTLDDFAVTPKRSGTPLLLIIVLTGALSLWWGLIGGGDDVWDWAQRTSPSVLRSFIPLVDFATSDTRFLASIALLVIWALGRRFNSPEFWRELMVGVLVVLSLSNHVPDWNHDFRRTRSASEIELSLGSYESRRIGEWLVKNSSITDLVATNNLVTESGSPSSDFSLAVWSERTFLVIAPDFFRGDSAELQAAVELSNRWANQPDSKLCDELRNRGVGWFIINLGLTNNRDWTVCAKERYRSDPFALLQILPAVTSVRA